MNTRYVKTEFWKATHNKFFYFALFIGMYLACYDLVRIIPEQLELFRREHISYLPNGQMWTYQNWSDTTVFINWMGMQMDFINRVVFWFGLPLLTALPHGWTGVRERKNGYRNHMLVKMKKREYWETKALAGFFLGRYYSLHSHFFYFFNVAACITKRETKGCRIHLGNK